jgi:hypothetical protein
MKQVIQINSLEALEKLIGGNSDVEIKVRNNVVQDFSKKYLKSVAHELCGKMQDDYILKRIENDTKEELYEYKYDDKGNRIYTGLKKWANFSDAIAGQSKESVKNMITNMVTNELKNSNNYIESCIDSYVDKKLKEKIDIIMKDSGYDAMMSEKAKAKGDVENYFKELEKIMDQKISELVSEKCRNIMERYKNEAE